MLRKREGRQTMIDRSTTRDDRTDVIRRTVFSCRRRGDSNMREVVEEVNRMLRQEGQQELDAGERFNLTAFWER